MANILIVEDDDSMAVLLREAMEGAGHVVAACKDWDAAREAIARQTPDLAILDYMLPGRSGRFIYDQLQASPLTKDLPILFITGVFHLPEEIPIKQHVKFMRKPLPLKLLHYNVRTLLALRKA